MNIDNKLHKTFLAQINSLAQTIQKNLLENNFTENNVYEYAKQFIELKNSILRVEQYKDVFNLLEINSKLPAKISNIFSFLLKPKWKDKDSYTEKVETYFHEVSNNLNNIYQYLKGLKI